VTPRLRRASLVLLPALAGCATHADLVQQERQVRGLIQEKGRQIEQLQREVERLRADVEEGGGHKHGAAADERLNAIEQRLAALEHGAPPPTAPEVQPVSPPSTTPPPAAAAKPAPAPAEDDEWRREIAREQSAAGTVNVPERADYLTMLDGLARKDCARAIPQLNSFATNHRDSPLADNALYWAARCYAATGKQNEAISKFYDVTLKYPKGDRAAAALWAQGNLFLEMGDTPDARINFSKLIRDYPSSDEAARARQKLMELEH